jgi:hypothetical protein
MAKKHMKKFSPSLAIKEMQIKTILKVHLTFVMKVIIKNTNSNKCWQGKKEPSYTAVRNINYGKQYGDSAKN